MIARLNLKSLALLFSTCLVMTTAGCSGGGGSSNSSGQTVVVGASNTLLAIEKTSLQLSETTGVTVTFTKADGTPASGVAVNFITTMGTLTPSGTVATNSDGVAGIQLTAGSTSGQGQLTASAMIDNKLVTTTVLFDVNLPTLKLANLKFSDSASISYGSSQGISVEVQDAAGAPYTAQAVDVIFTSPLSAQGKSTISSPVTTINGKASATYTATTATGTDTITASISGSSSTISLTINPLDAGSISFVSAAPTSIGLKGMGGFGIQETSKITFKVVDTSGAPKANQPVSFLLNTTVGDLSLSASSGSTGLDGTVSTIVQAGVVATPVRVTASTTVGNNTLSTQSDQLVISTGLPAQDGFSISRVNENLEGWDRDGVTTDVTARLSDHFHNPVPDGTAVYFTTSGGSITPSCVTTGGSCKVTWTSQNPRPRIANGASKDGRAVVLAYAVGEEFFLDLNGNGIADPTDTLGDDSEAFRDDDESRSRQTSETYIDFNVDGSFNLPDGQYNGVLQGLAFTSAPKTKHVFSNAVIVMASSSALITSSNDPIVAPGAFTITVTDTNGNTMPSGTIITVAAPFGTVTGATSHIVAQNIGSGVTLPISIAAGDSPKFQTGIITVTVKSPAGLETTRFINISGIF